MEIDKKTICYCLVPALRSRDVFREIYAMIFSEMQIKRSSFDLCSLIKIFAELSVSFFATFILTLELQNKDTYDTIMIPLL